jgi:phosphoribosyl-dephospho-CoA transferase
MTDATNRLALHRHDLVWLETGSDDGMGLDPADEDVRSRVREWIVKDRPFVVRQQGTQVLRTGRVALGLPLPPNADKRRIALTAPRPMIRRVSRAPALPDVIPHVPWHWRPPLAHLRQRAEAIGIAFHVFGSAAWQALTGLAYVTDASDVDLLWHPATPAQLTEGVAILDAWQRVSGIPADGEIVFGDDEAVAWREWQRRGNHAHVLVKRLDGSVMRAPGALLQMLGHPADADRVCGAAA